MNLFWNLNNDAVETLDIPYLKYHSKNILSYIDRVTTEKHNSSFYLNVDL